MNSTAIEKFGNRIRLRACGLCFKGDDILLINHKGLYGHDFWAPPGGGVEFGETVTNALKREFLEECKTEIMVGDFLFAFELVRPPLHAVELFFEVKLLSEPRLGTDPEMADRQIMSGMKFLTPAEVQAMPQPHRHGLFQLAGNMAAIRELRGFFTLA